MRSKIPGRVGRGRQRAKEAAKEHERQVKELRDRVGSLQNDRDQIRQELIEARSDLKTATVVREHLEERLSRSRSSPTKSKRKGSGKPKRPGRT